MSNCLHCGLDVPANSSGGPDFCCHGCSAAYGLINELGLGSYYQRRCLDPDLTPIRPDEEEATVDYSAHVTTKEEGGVETGSLHLMVEGLHCAACVWLIETVLARQPGVIKARVNMTTRRLELRWRAAEADANDLVAAVTHLGYRLVPFDPAILSRETTKREKELLRAMAVAGFAAGNVMLLSVSVWAGHSQGMGVATRELMHWLSALVALPAVAFAGIPFFRSAFVALRAGRVNMDVPISLGVVLASGISLFETMQGNEHAYFDSAITLLFFLLVGRYLDHRSRSRARSAAEHLLALNGAAATVIGPSGERRMVPPSQIVQGETVFVALGERIAVDGTISEGRGDVDASLITGETTPIAVEPGTRVFAGAINLSAPLKVTVDAAGEDTLLAEIVRLMENAEQGRARYVALADRVARFYGPIVHVMALGTFLGWVLAGSPWQDALLIAIAVLIITCPCALALAVPTVQVIASGRLLRSGVLVKSGTALERLAVADTIVFDKTGTLTEGKPELVNIERLDDADLRLGASLAMGSKHPLARALVRAAPVVAGIDGVREEPGLGLAADGEDGEVRLGSRAWCGPETGGEGEAPAAGPELWLSRPGRAPVLFAFTDRPRADAAETVAALKSQGYTLYLLSGDHAPAVTSVAEAVGIADWRASCSPTEKFDFLENLAAQGRKVVMVGDGLNDAPALAAAHVSLSPSTAVDISQTAADLVFQGARLDPVRLSLEIAKRADVLVKQNFTLAFIYNVVTIPIAVAGFVTPLVAAIAMSTSSVAVIANAMRLAGRKRQ
ncbi:MAG: heavy metal translocating P-type ATPase metal-binding domain-containing protein [Rhodospirillales bacterium]|nr:heavy metal translocating P-type ATPase metal-binding domain-containing protein [Rhodospirillales bacterium]MCW9002598.1 heavy metal translocating P-type ATPase metal-binding domain-containing protein [Rhodospirillales bacterium]